MIYFWFHIQPYSRKYITKCNIIILLSLATCSMNASEQPTTKNPIVSLLDALAYGQPSHPIAHTYSHQDIVQLAKENPNNPLYRPTLLDMNESENAITGLSLSMALKLIAVPVACPLKTCLFASLCTPYCLKACTKVSKHTEDARNHDHPLYEHFPCSLCKHTSE